MKRRIITTIAVVVFSSMFVPRLVPAAQAQASQAHPQEPGPAGGWDVTVKAVGQVKVFIVLTAGGGAFRTSQNDLLSTSLASPSYGSWKHLEEGEREFAITFQNFRYDSTGLIGASKIRVRATLEDRDHFKGLFTTQLLDLQGKVVTTIKGTVSGKRIEVEPPN